MSEYGAKHRFRAISRSVANGLSHLVLGPVAMLVVVLAPVEAAQRRPVAAVTIYPGDIIRDTMLSEVDFPDAVATSSYAMNRSMLTGKVARRTLLPGQPIPSNAIGEPKIVTVGAMVRLIYEEDGLSIATYASALQAGSAGDTISVRNPESGITISGVIHADGSIHIGNG